MILKKKREKKKKENIKLEKIVTVSAFGMLAKLNESSWRMKQNSWSRELHNTLQEHEAMD